ncbi:MAG TPA: cytochrome c-type biogenesis protein CcmH [Solirubrobacteraceae bacterium]|jgi:cytochrome c-type biogenesis protein CcmH|nr:cytochrome c-type biogenesis protein CcmH [Solirubrobacteraceae bacterium]
MVEPRPDGGSEIVRCLLAFTIALATALTLAATTPLVSAGAAPSGTSLPVIERQVMCVTCKIPLNVAESPQAERERALIRRLIAEGKTEGQVKRALVVQYGEAVLGLPGTKGFELTAYLIPVAVVLALLASLALLLPSWRRHARAQATSTPSAPKLSEGDAARLDADLKRFD